MSPALGGTESGLQQCWPWLPPRQPQQCLVPVESSPGEDARDTRSCPSSLVQTEDQSGRRAFEVLTPTALRASPIHRLEACSGASTSATAHAPYRTALPCRSSRPLLWLWARPLLWLTCWEGPPTPRTGPASPAGACGIGTPAGTPLPAALPTPGPPAAPARGTRAMPV